MINTFAISVCITHHEKVKMIAKRSSQKTKIFMQSAVFLGSVYSVFSKVLEYVGVLKTLL
ncbi:hypothetical protein DRN70_03520 [Methanosarcinales archaeon]|nr:MAG: hypothetical protein DRN70_03520 [Methanosarcinales archaeon]